MFTVSGLWGALTLNDDDRRYVERSLKKPHEVWSDLYVLTRSRVQRSDMNRSRTTYARRPDLIWKNQIWKSDRQVDYVVHMWPWRPRRPLNRPELQEPFGWNNLWLLDELWPSVRKSSSSSLTVSFRCIFTLQLFINSSSTAFSHSQLLKSDKCLNC